MISLTFHQADYFRLMDKICLSIAFFVSDASSSGYAGDAFRAKLLKRGCSSDSSPHAAAIRGAAHAR
jgi:hypothetical protein